MGNTFFSSCEKEENKPYFFELLICLQNNCHLSSVRGAYHYPRVPHGYLFNY